LINFGCVDGFWSLNRSRILRFENASSELDPDPNFLNRSGVGVWKCDSGHLYYSCWRRIVAQLNSRNGTVHSKKVDATTL